MIRSIGFVELNSIARGIETADFMVKAASVELIFAKTVCPGKFIILISGDIEAIHASVLVGRNHGGSFVVDSFELSNIDQQVVKALNAVTDISEPNAFGVVEYFSVSEAIIGADIAVKAANISIIEIRLGIAIGGKSFFSISGSVSAVEAAIMASKNIGEDRGVIVESCVIAAITKELYRSLI